MLRKVSNSVRASPVSYAEFFDVFTRELRISNDRAWWPKYTRIGIAVSGGADSMALAQLCSGLIQYEPAKRQFGFRFKAYIVDHNARENSTFEAQYVRDRLLSMDLSPHILRLTWPPGVKPLDLPDFETQARTLRYQALGTACRDSGIHSLLLGHHRDDQAETVLMRLAAGHRDKGLRGMLPNGDIPECWGVHGVHKSGTFESVAYRLRRLESQAQHVLSTPHAESLRHILDSDRTFEKGGIKIFRPLLAFDKDRLVETCRAHFVKWEDDKTNRDTWRTPRNAVRALMQSSKLPKALRKESMLRLARRKHELLFRTRATSRKLFANCEILLFDARCSGLIVRLPKRITSIEHVFKGGRRRYLYRTFFLAASLLQRLVILVSPREDTSLESLKFAALSIFPELRNNDGHADAKLQVAGLSASCVQFQRLHWPLSRQQPQSRHGLFETHLPEWGELDPDYVWKLTPQPYSDKIPTLTISPPASSSAAQLINGTVPPQSYPMPDLSPWSPWHLWDGRYWVRVLNRTSLTLVVRPLQPPDLQTIKASTSHDQWKTFHKLVALAAPNKVRWTLLTIAECSHVPEKLGKVLVLPTLGPGGVLDVNDENGNRKVEWEVRYKRVSFGTRNGKLDGNDSVLSRNRDFVTTWND